MLRSGRSPPGFLTALGVLGTLVALGKANQAFAGVDLQAIVFGAVAGFLLSTMLVYGALVLRDRRRSGSD